MPLPLPDLDLRTWGDLVDEARTLVHRYAPGWTDYNASDPGMTLLDLFAWLTEADVFSVDRIPRRHRAAFLALAGIALEPVRPVATVLQLASATGSLTVPAGVVYAARTDGAPVVVHRQIEAVDVLGCALAAVQVWTGSDYVDRTQDWRHATQFDALGPDPTPGAALLLGFDPAPALAPGAHLSLWLGLDDAASAAVEANTPAAHHSAHVLWEYHDGTDWQSFADVADDTRSLTRSGRVVVSLGDIGTASTRFGAITTPLRWVRARLAAGRHDVAPRAGLLVTDAARTVQATPGYAEWAFADATFTAAFALGSTVSFGLRTDADGRILELLPAMPGDPEALVLATSAGSLTVTLLPAGIADGVGSFATTAPGAPFTGANPAVWTADTGGVQAWTVVDTLMSSGPADRHVVTDPASGAVRFGDGEHGAIPARGSTVILRDDRTLGAGGNPTARAAWALDIGNPITAALAPAAPADLEVRAVLPVAARAAQDIEAGEGRAADEVSAHERLLQFAPQVAGATLDQLGRAAVLTRSRPERAATTLDFERMTLQVPGTAVVRARAWSGLDPALPGLAAPGTVTVVVVPGLPRGRPVPTPALLTEVRRYLYPRRTIGTRLVVTGPGYVEVSVQTTLAALPNVDTARVRVDALERLYAFLDPITGGPARQGWPFGRDVHVAEVLRELDLISGVDHVTELTMTVDGRLVDCARGCVGPLSVVVSGTHQVSVR